jgi:hypothetical protein
MVPTPPPPARNIDMDSFIETALRRNWRHGNGLCRAGQGRDHDFIKTTSIAIIALIHSA